MSELLIKADAGGSNSSRSRLRKVELQRLANETQSELIVAHGLPGTTKWNKKHRMFCDSYGQHRHDGIVGSRDRARGASQMAHGQRTEVQARGVLEACKRSGVGIEKFARSRGLVPQRLWWWKAKLGFGRVSNSAPALVPVRVTEARRGEPVTVLLRSGHMIKVGRDFDESAFARVVALLERE